MKWDVSRTDLLLDLYFLGAAYYVPVKGNKKGYHLFESDKATSVHLYKLAVREPEESVLQYAPDRRADRTLLPWDELDWYFLRLAISPKGRRNDAFRPLWLANLLGRE